MNEQTKIIELINISKEYTETIAVENTNLYINQGEFITLLGPSGCGKTTTLRMIAGFELPTTGQILLNGQDITNLPPHQRPVNTVFQRYALFPHLDVFGNIAFGLRQKKITVVLEDDEGNRMERQEKLTQEEIQEKVKKALKMVDLEGFEHRNISTLSGGQQQRIAIARAIVNEPQILLLDEPLGALDLKMRKEMQTELKEMHRKLGLTFIYVTHDQEEALTMSDTIVVMKDGTIQQIGKPMDIYNEPKNTFVADFIGESNIFSATMTDSLKVKFAGTTFACVDDFKKHEKVDVVIRPEDIKLGKAGLGQMDGQLVSKTFKGVHFEYVVMQGKNEFLVHTTENWEIDQTVSLTIAPDDIHIMKKEFSSNKYDGLITKNNTVAFGDGEFECDVTQLYKNSKLDDEGYLICENGEKLDLTNTEVEVTISLSDIEISDEYEDAPACGNIVSIIYKGDHYQLIVRTEESEEDFVLDTEDTWNENDKVGVFIKRDKVKMKLKRLEDKG